MKIKENISTELSPGTTPRRWIPDGGEKKLRHKIHNDSKIANSKELPFTFSKPKRPGRKKYVKCLNCGNIIQTNINTVGIICNNCKEYSSVEEVILDE